MRDGWVKGTPLLVKSISGSHVRCSVIAYDCEGFYKIKVEEGEQAGCELIVHEDDATRDETAGGA